MRKVLVVTATMIVGMALLSCTAPGPPAVHATPTPPMFYEPPAKVARAPLPGLVGYASPPPLIDSPTPLAPYGNSPNERAEPQTAAHLGWRASPRWSAVKGKGCIVVEQDPQAAFAAQAKAAKVRVKNCSKEDIDGLNPARLKELRDY